MECFACIHCHFYQPPRENPWLEAVEAQDSASPYHDWNERIARECYLPNGASRILDSHWRIKKIVNNYARISFNFGPTLLSWMEDRAPEGYQKILDGDREGQRLFSGHGGALAQAYNHAILPLCNSRDQRTQIVWGIKDFQQRFRRDPEGMWLPETAVETETLEILSAEGIKFTILAPRQAGRLRVEGTSRWADLEYGIDSRRPYACPLPSGRTIGLFFYDGALATAVAFERLLYNGENFARRLVSRFDPEGDSAQLMHVATDGESYGHHHPHGDMALAYALQYIEENRLARITNYGEYFEQHPPTQEVKIKERSSWSCVHGVSRWESNCGCNSGGHQNWNQEWRRPLRSAFDWLRDELSVDFSREAKKLLLHPWLARDEYIDVILDRSAPLEPFLTQHGRRVLNHEERVRVLRLLDMERHLMLMYTSCGWFFDEPTGPETIQVLQYAARALQLGHQLFEKDLEEEFLKRLENVHSNIPEFGNGRSIYEKFVRPAMLDLPGVAAHFAISSFFRGQQDSNSIYSYSAQLRNVQRCESEKLRLCAGTVRIVSRVTHVLVDFNFAVLYGGGHNLCAGIAPKETDFDSFVQEIRSALPYREFDAVSQQFPSYFGRDIYSLESLFHDERRRIVAQIVDSKLADLDRLYGKVYDENTSLIAFLRKLNMPLPPILRVSSEFVLKNAIRRCLDPAEVDFNTLGNLLQAARQHGITLDASIASAFRCRFEALMERWAEDPLSDGTLSQLQALHSLLRAAPFDVDLWTVQNKFHEVMSSMASMNAPELSDAWLQQFRALGEGLGISVPQLLASGTKSERRQTRGEQVPLPPPDAAVEPALSSSSRTWPARADLQLAN